MRRAVVALAVVLALPAAAAAAPWSAPRDVSRPHTFIDDVSIAFVPSGAGLIGWRTQDGAGTACAWRRVRRRALGGRRPRASALRATRPRG